MSFARCALSYRGNCREVEASRGLAHRAKRNAHRSCAPILHGSPASHYKDVPPMQITDILNQTGGLQSIARELGISESEAASGAAALAPAILGGVPDNVRDQPAR